MRSARTHAPLLALLLMSAPGVLAATPDCRSIRCAARAEIDAACPCDQPNHGRYVGCVVRAAKRLGIPPRCRGEVASCAARSVCGKEGRVICTVPVFGTCDLGSGTCLGTSSPCGSFTDCVTGTRCKRALSAAQCERQGGTVSAATSCCEDCGATPPTTTSTTGPPTTSVTSTSTSSSTSTTAGSPHGAFVEAPARRGGHGHGKGHAWGRAR